jgi:hypothetical protein
MKKVLLAIAATAVLATAPQAQAQTAPPVLPTDPVPQGTAFEGNGMWIWYVSQSNGGSVSSIARRAAKAGVTTLFIKSSDGARPWSQFTPALVEALHARGLKVCGWGYVYGNNPRGEARAARTAIQRGADCFVIDAETEYEGKYAAADLYMRKLRAYAGPDYPIGVAPFPYVDYHPGYPYSVFLGPGGAQFNLPQMYWRAIGVSVKTIYARTYNYGTLYGRPIYPLGQTYGGVKRLDITCFRRYAQLYGATGLSWWSWQATPSSGWSTLAQPLPALPADSATKPPATPTLKKGARGDFIVWAQQHLRTAGQSVKVNGVFDGRTTTAVKALQTASALPATGQLDPATWNVLLAQYDATPIRWSKTSAKPARAKRGQHADAPRSAALPPVRNELRGLK